MRQLVFLLAVIGTFVPFARGAIVVGANGSGIHSFTTRPEATEWSTKSITGSDVLFASLNDLNNAVQTNVTAASANLQVLDAAGATPPGQNTVAAWSSGGVGALWTRPTANGATILMATLMNGTGADQNALRIAYTLGQSGATPTEQAPAHQVYYSFSGELGSWVNIPGLSGGSAGFRSNVVTFATAWTNGAPLYVLWLDDNATGGVDRGYFIDDISFAPVGGLTLGFLPDLIGEVLKPILLRVPITESNGPNTRLTFSLDPGAPSTARINPTNGLFIWLPQRADAGTTNSIIIRATENGSSLTATQRFTIALRDYFEVTLGSTLVEPGQRTNISIGFDSTTPLTNLSFRIPLPFDRFADPGLSNISPALVSTLTIVPNPDFLVLNFAMAGQSLVGSQELARLHFTAVSTQSSAFIPLQPYNVFGSPETPGVSFTVLTNDGRIVVINGEPLLESFQTGGVRTLALFGNPGTNYLLETSTNLAVSWQPWQSVTPSNLLQFVDASAQTNAPIILYRARRGNAAPAPVLSQAPVEFKAATKLQKRKIAAALKRQKRLHARFPWPPPTLLP